MSDPICFHCHAPLPPAGRVCPQCGRELPAPAPATNITIHQQVDQVSGTVAGVHADTVGQMFITVHPPAPPAAETPLPPLPPADTIPDPGPAGPGWRLPFNRNALFTGREAELLALAQALFYAQPARERRAVVTEPPATETGGGQGALQGIGGIGKTQLAVELCYRYGRFTRGVHWLNAAQAHRLADLNSELAECSRLAEVQPWPEEQPEQVGATLNAFCKDPQRLVVLDNPDHPELLDELLPRLGGVRLLITIRRSDLPPELGLHVRRLEVFSPPESLAYLRRSVPRLEACPEAELSRLAERLGRLPLALSLAASYLRVCAGVAPATYLREIERLGSALDLAALPESLAHSPTRHNLSLYATFKMSWELLGEADEDRLAKRCFCAAGYCAPGEPIPVEVFRRLVDGGQPDFALARLEAVGLVECTEQGVVLHPLVAEMARKLDREAPESNLSAAGEELARLVCRLDRKAQESTMPALRKALAKLARRMDRKVQDNALMAVGEVLAKLARWLDRKAQKSTLPAVGEALAKLARQLDRESHGNNLPALGRVLAGLSCDLIDSGFPGNFLPLRPHLAPVAEALWAQDAQRTATLFNNLGFILNAAGDLSGALPYYEQALAIKKAILGEQHPDTAAGLNNLGYLLYDMGNPSGARPYYEQALAIRRTVLGEKHPDTAQSLNNLGRLLQDMGDLSGARRYLEQALAIDKAVLGEQHPTTAINLGNLGSLLRAMGDLSGARQYFEQALAIHKAVLGEQHPDTAHSLNNLGCLLEAMGNLSDARRYLEQALSIQRAVLGEQHRDTALSLNNLGGLLQDMGDMSGAREYFEQALAIFEVILPPGHPKIQLVRNNLAALPNGTG